MGEILEALGGRSFERMLERFLRRPGGAAIWRRRTPLFDVLSDLEALRQLPEDSLGHAYARYVERERLDLEALQALRPTPATGHDTAEILEASLRDRTIAMHDLLHVLTGYGRDLVGEASLNAIAWAQTGNPATAFIWAALRGHGGALRCAPLGLGAGCPRSLIHQRAFGPAEARGVTSFTDGTGRAPATRSARSGGSSPRVVPP